MIKLILSFLLLTCTVADKKEAKVKNEKEGFAVIELFTSEGCSSCPPADKLLEIIDKEYVGKNVLVLSYHVDYWNKLGWKDEFSNAENTARQGYYANIFRLNSIYTPQAVINGATEFVGSDRSKMTNAIERSKKMNKTINLNASANNNKVTVDYKINDLSTRESILVALIQKQATTEVKRGENGGRKLHHINIVRQFEIMKKDKDSLQFTLPEKTKGDYFIIALVQNKATGSIDGYSQTIIN
jgi:hypothetical protein